MREYDFLNAKEFEISKQRQGATENK